MKNIILDSAILISEEKTILEDDLVIYLQTTGQSTEIIMEISPLSDCFGLHYDLLINNEPVIPTSTYIQYQRTTYVLDGTHKQVYLKNIRYYKKLGYFDLDVDLD